MVNHLVNHLVKCVQPALRDVADDQVCKWYFNKLKFYYFTIMLKLKHSVVDKVMYISHTQGSRHAFLPVYNILNNCLIVTLLFLARRSHFSMPLILKNIFRPTFHFVFKEKHSWHSIAIYLKTQTVSFTR